MIAPSTINPRVYKYVFVLSIKNDNDNTETFGRFVKSNNEPRNLQTDDEYEDETASP